MVAQGLVYGKSFTGCPCENINDFGNLVGSDAKTKLSRCPLPNGSSHLSPVSILDASFSNESCFSPESNDGCGGMTFLRFRTWFYALFSSLAFQFSTS